MIACINMTILKVAVHETSAGGHRLSKIDTNIEKKATTSCKIKLDPENEYQTIIGFGGSFTESTAFLLNQLSKENKRKILHQYFSDDGARYSLTRTHINSCDFSLGNYSYAPVSGDKNLEHFTIERDQKWIIPVIKEALTISSKGFKIIASPWTAPPWMKNNKQWIGGKLLPKYYDTWARYFAKYLNAYSLEGVSIWGITIENEPLGNDNNWESMHFTPEEMSDFASKHLAPMLEKEVADKVQILGFDQNRDELKEWADRLYGDSSRNSTFDGLAVHWYASTYKIFSKELQYAHQLAPEKVIIQTEACVDAQVPRWKDDDWYWSKSATDWGWHWAPAEKKDLHTTYVPVFRYARDIIGCLNNWVSGWIDWNMVLNRQGGPNWAKNWCTAPVIVDEKEDEVYFTPLYYTISHFSKFIRPGAKRISLQISDNTLIATAVKNPDGRLVIVVLNQESSAKSFQIEIANQHTEVEISGKAIQTIEIQN